MMRPRILLVVSPERQERLLDVLDASRFELEYAITLQGAVARLGAAPFDLVFADIEVEGGAWKQLLQEIRTLPAPPVAVICARLGDHDLWSEVLQSGAQDLVTEPFERKEVTRILDAALARTAAAR